MAASARTIGNYTLGPLLGRGGMSEVYAGEDRTLGTPVAVKLLRPDLVDRDAAARAFEAEATRTRAVQHPNVVRVLDFGQSDGLLYLVMERLAGEDLATRLRRLKRLGEGEARALGAAIADGAAAAHACGIVHRDLKPANVMIEPDGRPKLVDFGIAKALGNPVATGPRTGTPAYMAPEQLVSNIVTPFVDIWALGVILFELVAGTPPFDCRDGKAPQLAESAPSLVGLASVSGAYAGLVAACLAKEPSGRPTSMAEVAQMLRGEAGGDRLTESLGDPDPAGQVPVAARATHGRTWAVAFLIACAVIGSLAAWGFTRGGPDAVPRDAAVAAVVAVDAPATVVADAVVAVIALEPPAATIEIEIRSRPGGATITIDGRKSGRTPKTLSVRPGAAIALARAGYRAATVRADRAGLVDVGLVALPARRTTMKRAGETLD